MKFLDIFFSKKALSRKYFEITILTSILMVALILRLAVLVLVVPTPFAGDEGDFFNRAKTLVTGGQLGVGWLGRNLGGQKLVYGRP